MKNYPKKRFCLQGENRSTATSQLFATITFLLFFHGTFGQTNVDPTFDNGNAATFSIAQNAKRKDISEISKVTDPDKNQVLTWTIVNQPLHGTVYGFPAFSNSGHGAIVPGGGLSYEPTTGQTGSDSFIMKISDGIGSSQLTVLVNIISSVIPPTPPDPGLDPGTVTNNNLPPAIPEVLPRNISIVEQYTGWSVPFGSSYPAERLPVLANVTYENMEEEALQINWFKCNFNGDVAGVYLLIGDLLLTEGGTNTRYIKAQITITVLQNEIPANIILSNYFISAEGSTADPNSQSIILSNYFTTVDLDDSVHTYLLVEGDGDSDNCKFGVAGGVLSIKSANELSGKTEFFIRVRSTDSSNNYIEKAFILHIAAEEEIKPIEIPNTFSPNGDGVNDTWILPELKDYQNVDVTVYDRSGTLMFHSTNPLQGWDGKNLNGKIIAGMYFYIIKIGDTDEKKQGILIVLTN